jgi:hypothetical protein
MTLARPKMSAAKRRSSRLVFRHAARIGSKSSKRKGTFTLKSNQLLKSEYRQAPLTSCVSATETVVLQKRLEHSFGGNNDGGRTRPMTIDVRRHGKNTM